MMREESDIGQEGISGTQVPPRGMPNPKDGELHKRPIFLSVPTLVHPGKFYSQKMSFFFKNPQLL